ncbi:hypothetical protein AAVH_29484 [Aphelenchoides avenae]|nr:hypothetical protein AAVH_29484 [Aphelenchus avenae]
MLPCNGQPGPSSSAASGSSRSGDAPSVLNIYDASVGPEFLDAFEQCAQSSSTANVPVDVSMLRGMDYAPYASPAFTEGIPIQQQIQMDSNIRCYSSINPGQGVGDAHPAVYSQAARYPMPDQMFWSGMMPPTVASNATYANCFPQHAQGPSYYTYINSVSQNPPGPATHAYASFIQPNPQGLSTDPFTNRIAGLVHQELPSSSLPVTLNASSSAIGNVSTLAEVLQSTSPPTFRHEGFDYSFLFVASDGHTCMWRCQFHKRRCLGTLREDVLAKTFTLTRKHNHPPVAGGSSSDTTPQLSRCPSVVEMRRFIFDAESSLQPSTASSAVKESEDELPTDLARQTPPSTIHRAPPATIAHATWSPPSNPPPACSALPALNLEHYRDDSCLARIWQRNESLFGDSATFHVYWPEYAGIEHVFRTRRDRFFKLKDDLDTNVPTSGPSGEERKAELACARIEFEKSIHRLIRFLVLARSVPQDLRRCLEVGMGFNSIFRQLRLPCEQVQDPLRNDLYDWNEDQRCQLAWTHLYDKTLKAENVILFRCLFENCQYTTESSDQRTQRHINASLRKHYYKHVPKIETCQNPSLANDQLLTMVPADSSLVSTPISDGIQQQGFPETAFASISKYIETTFPPDQSGDKRADAHGQQEGTPASAHLLDQDEPQDDGVEMVTIEINNSFSTLEPDAAQLSPTLQEFLNFVEPSSQEEHLQENGMDDTQKETTGSLDRLGAMPAADAPEGNEPAPEIESGSSHARVKREPCERQEVYVRPTEDHEPETSSPPPDDNRLSQASNGKGNVPSPSKMTIRMRPLHTEDIPRESMAAISLACETGVSQQPDIIMRKEDSASEDRSSVYGEKKNTPAVGALEPVPAAPSEPVDSETASRASEDTIGPRMPIDKSRPYRFAHVAYQFSSAISLSPSKMIVRMRPLRPTDGSAQSPDTSRAMLVGSSCMQRGTDDSDDDDNVCDGEPQSDGPIGSPFTTDGEEAGSSTANNDADAMQVDTEELPEMSLKVTSLDDLEPADYFQFFERGERRRWRCRFVDCDYSNNSHAPMIQVRQMLKKHCQEAHFSGI